MAEPGRSAEPQTIILHGNVEHTFMLTTTKTNGLF